MAYKMTVVTLDGAAYDLPADAVTCDAPPQLALGGPLLPLAFRSPQDVFYVRGGRWPELAGKALRVNVRVLPHRPARPSPSSHIDRWSSAAAHHRVPIHRTPA